MYIRGGSGLIPAGDPLKTAQKWFNAGAELIHIVDLDAPAIGASPNTEFFKKLGDKLKVAYEIEANVRSIDTVEKYINAGACRITLGTIAYRKPAFLSELCERFPKKVAVHIDVRRSKVAIRGWSVATNKTAVDYVKQFRDAGVNFFYYSDSEEEGGALKPADFGRIRDFLRKTKVEIIHTTDVSSIGDIEQLIMLESYGLRGTLLTKSLNEGRIDLEAAITFTKNLSRSGADESTYME